MKNVKVKSTRGERFDGATQTVDHPVLPKRQHRFKQRRRHSLPHNGDARGID
jgi:hypothetical protein